MTYVFRAKLFTVVLVAMCSVPTVLLATPLPAHAQQAVIDAANLTANKASAGFDLITSIKSTLSAALDVTNTAANVAKQIKSYVLDPIAFVVSGNLLKSITSSVIGFVGGKNGTGRPLYVQNLSAYLQNVGDVRAYSFLSQFSSNSNSPFAAGITSSLRANYLQQTSMAGFFAANRNTLSRYSPNVNSFLAGNWSAGGAAAWFALTTQDQNNPYTLYYRSQDQMTRSIQDATSAKLAQLNWGQGFLSWCGSGSSTLSAKDTTLPASGNGGGTGTATGGTTPTTTGASGGLTQSGETSASGNQDSTAKDNNLVGQANSVAVKGSVGVNPGDPCTKSDGSEGNIQTPGSIIKYYLSKALGSDIDKLAGVGDIGAQISGIMGNIGTVMKTVDLAAGLFSGTNGLFGSSVTGVGGYTSPFQNYLNSSTYMGLTVQDIGASVNNSGLGASDLSSRANQYEAAWNAIRASATTASVSLAALATSCPTQASVAQSALATEVNPVLTQAASAATIVTNARAQVAKVQNEGYAGDAAYAGDLANLVTLRPSATDVAQAQQEAQGFGDASASPAGSLNVRATSLLDQMNLVYVNSENLRYNPVTCPPPPARPDETGLHPADPMWVNDSTQ